MSSTKVEYRSASQVALFLSCPLAYKYIYVDGAIRLPGNIYTEFGSSIHETLAYNFQQKITTRQDLEIMSILAFFKDNFIQKIDKLNQLRIDTSGSQKMILQGEELQIKYMKEKAPSIQPIKSEETIDIKLNSVDVTIRVIMDLITEDGGIVDFKTVGQSSEAKWSQSYVDNLIQFTFYALGFRKIYGKAESYIRADLLKRLKTCTGIDSLNTYRSEIDIMAMVNLLQKMEHIIKNDLWFGNFNSCSTCQFKDSCDRGALMLK